MASAATAFLSANVYAAAPYLPTQKPIFDAKGQISVIIDLVDIAHLAYPTKLPIESPFKAALHSPQALNMVADFEQRYGFKRTGMTSWVGNSITAYLPQATIDALLNDKLVKLVSADSASSLSAQPPWGNSSLNSEWKSYGANAIGAQVAPTSSNRRVYVIDEGIA